MGEGDSRAARNDGPKRIRYGAQSVGPERRNGAESKTLLLRHWSWALDKDGAFDDERRVYMSSVACYEADAYYAGAAF